MQEFYVTANGATFHKYVAETLQDSQEMCAHENGFNSYRELAIKNGLARCLVA